jgi:hypothetical protein
MSLLFRVIVALAAGAAAGVIGSYVIRAAIQQTAVGQIDAGRFDQWLLVGLVVPLVVIAPLVFLATRRQARPALS